MNKTLTIVVILIIVIGGIWYFSAHRGNNTPTATTTPQTSTAAHGSVYLGITDAAANMTAINDIELNVSKVALEGDGGAEVVVSNTPQTFNLLSLNKTGQIMLAGNVDASAGTYHQVMLEVSSVTIDKKDGTKVQAKLPSGELRINNDVTVTAGQSSAVTLDFLASQSLHTTGKGEFIFAPVINLKNQSGSTVNVDANTHAMAVVGGNVDGQESVGQDVDGSVKANFHRDTSAGVDIDVNVAIQLHGAGSSSSSSSKSGGSTSAGATTNTKVNTGTSGTGATGSVGGSVNVTN